MSTWFGARSPPPFQIPPSGKKDPSKPLGIEKRRSATCSRRQANGDRVCDRSRRVGVTPDSGSPQNRAATRWRHAVRGVRRVWHEPRWRSGPAPRRLLHENRFSHATSSSSSSSRQGLFRACCGSPARGRPAGSARVLFAGRTPRRAPGVAAVAAPDAERVGCGGESCGPHRNSLERSSWRDICVIRVSPTGIRHARVSMKNYL